MTTNNNEVIEQFIINVSLIDPVAKIIQQLENREFRDCDINWLNKKLVSFTEFTCKTLGISLPIFQPFEKDKSIVLNDWVRAQYLSHFTILLNYFKTL